MKDTFMCWGGIVGVGEGDGDGVGVGVEVATAEGASDSGCWDEGVEDVPYVSMSSLPEHAVNIAMRRVAAVNSANKTVVLPADLIRQPP